METRKELNKKNRMKGEKNNVERKGRELNKIEKSAE
jgi:hypothetical protein